MMTWMRAAKLLVAVNIILVVAVVIAMTLYKQTGSTSYTDTSSSVIDAQLAALSTRTDSGITYPRDWAVFQEVDSSLWKSAAHLVIDPRANYTGTVPILNWREGSNCTYVGKSIERDAGSLTVTDSGYYFIYSQILYRGEGTRELDYGRVLHIVLKQRVTERPESPTILMRNLISTPSIRRGHMTYASSVLGATFFLEPHTRLSVQSSIPANIDASGSPHSNVFGLFLV
ncbi:tumor necrosis factor-like [Haliotis asinina]|uniref:tumor necrosis factor-like n=1 Tax=Haliotis asinina TaxID=109174 RepID=UPI0035322E45